MIQLLIENSFQPMQIGLLIVAQLSALVLDQILGEPRRFHPLAGFGYLTERLEANLNSGAGRQRQLNGLVAWCLLVIPITLISATALWLLALWSNWAFWLTSTFIHYVTIGAKSLRQHAIWVAKPLANDNIDEARDKVSWLVSRDTKNMDSTQINKACIESVLENGNDAIFGALFWFLIAGAPGAILYRLTNTLDACWGYRSERFKDFGWWSARADDWLNLIPARICASTYSFCGNWRNALESWRNITTWRLNEGRGFGSPNAGVVMASGAGALELSLGGGSAEYHGTKIAKPELGLGGTPTTADIYRSVALLTRALLLFLVLQCGVYVACALAFNANG